MIQQLKQIFSVFDNGIHLPRSIDLTGKVSSLDHPSPEYNDHTFPELNPWRLDKYYYCNLPGRIWSTEPASVPLYLVYTGQLNPDTAVNTLDSVLYLQA